MLETEQGVEMLICSQNIYVACSGPNPKHNLHAWARARQGALPLRARDQVTHTPILNIFCVLGTGVEMEKSFGGCVLRRLLPKPKHILHARARVLRCSGPSPKHILRARARVLRRFGTG